MNLWIELTALHSNRKLVFNVSRICYIFDGESGAEITCDEESGSSYVKESYAEVKQKIEDAMNTYTRLFGNQYVNFPPIKTTTDDLAINKL